MPPATAPVSLSFSWEVLAFLVTGLSEGSVPSRSVFPDPIFAFVLGSVGHVSVTLSLLLLSAISELPVSFRWSAGLSGQGHLAVRGLAHSPDTHPQSATPLQCCSKSPLRGWGSSGDLSWMEGGREEGAAALAGGGHVGWEGGSLPGRRLLGWEQTVFTLPTHPAHSPLVPGSHPCALQSAQRAAALSPELRRGPRRPCPLPPRTGAGAGAHVGDGPMSAGG